MKVQHKQIRSRDSDGRDSPEDMYLDSVDANFQRTQFPGSEQDATTNLWTESALTNEPTIEEGVEVNNQDEEKVDYEITNLATETSLQSGSDCQEEASPLDTLAQIQNALPDLSTNVVVN